VDSRDDNRARKTSVLNATIQPNPVNNVVTVQFPQDEQSGMWEFLDVAGNLLKAGNWETGETLRIETSGFSNGAYILHWKGASGSIRNEKVIILH
jgi:hypothetical protein